MRVELHTNVYATKIIISKHKHKCRYLLSLMGIYQKQIIYINLIIKFNNCKVVYRYFY